MADRSDYPTFVDACWTRLLRTAYLLVQDWATAEDLTQAALVKAWLAWRTSVTRCGGRWAACRRASASVTSYSGPPLPARFTASDGAAYRQLAVTSLSDPDQKTAALTVRVGSDPVDVMGACDRPAAYAYMLVKVNGTYTGLIKCQRAPQPIGLPVRPGRTAVITFVPATGPLFREVHADWQLAAYTWTPPATVRPAPAAPRLPQSYTGPNTTTGHGNALRKLVASRSGTWPRDRTATFTLTYHGHSLDFSTVCAGLIGGRLQVSHEVDGSPGEAVPCTPAGPGWQESSGGLSGVNGEPITLTFHVQAPSSYFAADYASARPAGPSPSTKSKADAGAARFSSLRATP